MYFYFFFTDTATTEIYTLSLHDALPICRRRPHVAGRARRLADQREPHRGGPRPQPRFHHHRLPLLHGHRSEEHTSELQSHSDLVCRLLLEKKKKKTKSTKANESHQTPNH